MFRRSLALAVVLICAGSDGFAAESPPANAAGNPLTSGFPNIPADARRVAERLASCTHFAGEINGDGGERDKEVGVTMSELNCDTIDKDVAAMRRKYAADPDANKALDRAENP